jgi:hypothetical protein
MDGNGTAFSYEAKRPIVINNFLGFIGSLSTPVLDLNDTGDMYLEIRWASPNVCWGTANTTAPTYTTTTGCYLDNLRKPGRPSTPVPSCGSALPCFDRATLASSSRQSCRSTLAAICPR